ncbi:GNAT family N-acetyltransferase [Budvicia diplopodorum]|uniref:GNAT family N-acetyltransferase n=1 Tax=Budvicia diplopodorum TaxID=1119056 RepID=UPI00135C5678|nr:N-acetyltransferase [Budvicia diplopodorum]
MLIRVEIPVDAAGIAKLLRKVFAGNREADLIQQLREDGLITLGVVATDDYGGIIGYAAFSPVMVNGEDRLWVGLAPLAVSEKHQGKGIGKALVYEGLDTLNEFSYAAVAVLGDPAYYAPFGFKPAAEFNLHSQWPDVASAFQIYSLADDALVGVSGLVEYSAPFDQLPA